MYGLATSLSLTCKTTRETDRQIVKIPFSILLAASSRANFSPSWQSLPCLIEGRVSHWHTLALALENGKATLVSLRQ